jgi:molybdopterin molybdotransferase
LSHSHELQLPFEWQGFGRLMPLNGAFAALVACCREIPPVQMGIEDALDRITAAPIHCPAAIPPYPIALCDGWAVASADTLDASSYAPGLASAMPRRVAFGDQLPDFADAVLPLPNVGVNPNSLDILSSVAPGEGVRARGGDFAEGETIVPEGTQLQPIHIALLRVAGIETVAVRPPRVCILSQSSAGNWLADMVRREGADCWIEASDGMAPEHLVEAMARSNADLAIMTGVGGAEGSVAQIVAQAGQILFHGVAVRPGEMMGCGSLPRRAEPPSVKAFSIKTGDNGPDPASDFLPILFTAERLECVLAVWLLLVRPYLRRLAGATFRNPAENLPLTRKIVSMPGLSELVLVRRATNPQDGAAQWKPLATGDIPFAAIARADAWLLVEPEFEGYAARQHVVAELL